MFYGLSAALFFVASWMAFDFFQRCRKARGWPWLSSVPVGLIAITYAMAALAFWAGANL